MAKSEFRNSVPSRPRNSFRSTDGCRRRPSREPKRNKLNTVSTMRPQPDAHLAASSLASSAKLLLLLLLLSLLFLLWPLGA